MNIAIKNGNLQFVKNIGDKIGTLTISPDANGRYTSQLSLPKTYNIGDIIVLCNNSGSTINDFGFFKSGDTSTIDGNSTFTLKNGLSYYKVQTIDGINKCKMWDTRNHAESATIDLYEYIGADMNKDDYHTV